MVFCVYTEQNVILAAYFKIDCCNETQCLANSHVLTSYKNRNIKLLLEFVNLSWIGSYRMTCG